jgi:DNA-binding CsgD family transcriptional regulator
MMEGLHDHWIYLGYKSDITFSGLAPGEYVFRVAGSNNDGVWNERGTSLKIIIKPPFWQTWWFRALVLLLVGLLLFTWHQTRMKRVSLQLKTEKEMNRLFTKYQISNREQEIIHLILKGKTNKEIEDTLFISLPTVKFHIYSIYKKMKVKNRLELIRIILESVKTNHQPVSDSHHEE